MSMRPLFLALATLIAVCGWVAWSERELPQQEVDAKRLFPNSALEAVHSILWLEGERVLRISRDPDGSPYWFVAGDPQRLASEAHVLAAIRSVSTLRSRRQFEPEGDPSEYGFSTLSPQIRLEGQGDVLAEIHLGAVAPLSAGRYLKTTSSKALYLVAEDLLEPALRDPLDFLDLRLLGIAPGDVTSIKITRANEASSLTIRRQEEDDFFLFTTSSAAPISITQEPVSDLLFTLAELRGTRIAEQSEVDKDTLEPSWTLDVTRGDGRKASLTLGPSDPQGDIYAIASGDALPRGVGDQLLLVDTALSALLENNPWLVIAREDGP